MDHTEAIKGSADSLSVIRVSVPTSFGKGRKRAVSATPSAGDLDASSIGAGAGLTPADMGMSSYSGFQKPTLRVRPIPTSKWVVDGAADSCQAVECKQNFSMFTRKHHCRSCGFIFCGNCSANFLPLEIPLPANATPAQQQQQTSSSVRLCQSCYYDHQLVVHRLRNGNRRKKTCGVFKRMPLTMLIRFAAFLSVEELQVYALLSGDFYFASRDNKLWTTILARHGWTDGSTIAAANSPFNYTSFLSYVQRQTHEQCAGIASFASGLRELLSSSVKVGVVGPPGVGKSIIVENYCGAGAGGSPSAVGGHGGGMAFNDRQGGGGMGVNNAITIGMTAKRKRTVLAGALSTETTVSIYDTNGGDRYGWMRNLAVTCSHVVVLCYDAHSKVSLVKAALMMEEIEPNLTGQTVVVCGLVRDRNQKIEVAVGDAEAATVRCGASIQVLLTEPHALFGCCVQTVIDRIATTFTPFLPVPTVLDVLLQ